LLAALFDIDGTLADTDVHHRAIFRDLLAEEGIACDTEFFEKRISGRANAQIVAELLPHYTPEQQDAWVVKKEALFRERAAAGLEPLEGLLDLLRSFRAKGVRTAAVTNAPKLNAHMILRALNLHPDEAASELPFELIVLGDECSQPKPHPEPYLVAMRHFGLADTPERCVVFEDSLPGCRAGKASGAITVGVRTSQTDAALKQAGAHCSVPDFSHIDHDKLIGQLSEFVKSDEAAPSQA
jgi:HAD superfamily hydrolase (TIGR01509 family)